MKTKTVGIRLPMATIDTIEARTGESVSVWLKGIAEQMAEPCAEAEAFELDTGDRQYAHLSYDEAEALSLDAMVKTFRFLLTVYIEQEDNGFVLFDTFQGYKGLIDTINTTPGGVEAINQVTSELFGMPATG